MKTYFETYTTQLKEALDSIHVPILDIIKSEIETALCLAFPIFTFGNGGSAAIAEHVVSDLVKCVGHDTNLNPFVMNLASNTPLMTCISNDLGYEYVFSRQLDWYQQPGAIALGISSSGNSANIQQAFFAAKKNGMKTIAFVGFDGGCVLAGRMADHIIHVKSSNYGIVEDAHMIILHAIIQKIRLNNCEDINKVKL